ncbi:MAG: hypothetical protein AAFV69_01215 [Pseudomonadota bacterium]
MRLAFRDGISLLGTFPNEDRYGFNDHAAWIIDGATDLIEEKRCPGPSDAAWFAQALNDEIGQALTTPSCDLKNLVDRLSQSMASRFEVAAVLPVTEAYQKPSAAGAILQLTGTQLRAIGLGDCTILRLCACRHPHAPRSAAVQKIIGPETADEDVRAEVAKLQRSTKEDQVKECSSRAPAEQEPTPEKIRQDLMPFLRASRAQMNKPYGYGIFSIDATPPHFIEKSECEVISGDQFLLATDGFMRLVDVFQLYNLTDLVSAIQTHGIARLIDELRNHETNDATCHNEPRAKCHDDATAVLLEVTA